MKAKHFVLEAYGTGTLLPPEERIKLEQEAFTAAYPEFEFTNKGEKFPFTIKIVNNLTGEVRWMTCKDRVDPVVLEYSFNGKKLDSLTVYDEILKEMYV